MMIVRGDTIQWSSAAGILKGVVDSIVLDLNAANQIVPWMVIKEYNIRMCATDNNLKMMKVKVL